jgi:peptidoglycan/LPS O-acetylase OafA/YrhL
MPRVPAERFSFVDALRGIAAMGVVLFHLREGHHVPLLASALPTWAISVVDHGNLGVAVFFVLSGFVIAHSVYNERVTIPFAGRFMLRRSLRLDPPYWLAIALCLAFAALSSFVIPQKHHLSLSFGQLIAHLFYLQEILGYPEINSVFWTLCLEVQFYLIYMFLLALGKNDPLLPAQGNRLLMVLLGAITISIIWPVGLVTVEPWPGSFLPLWHGFLLGAAAYWAWRYRHYRVIYAGFALIVFVAAALHGNAFSLTCAVVSFLLLAVGLLGQMTTALAWPWLRFLGVISYTLYLIHNPITGASFSVGYSFTGHTLVTEIIWTLCTLGACLVSSFGLYLLIEKPSIRLAHTVNLHAPLSIAKMIRHVRN